MFGFWAGQSLKLRTNACFRGIKPSLAVNVHVPKSERLALSKMVLGLLPPDNFPLDNCPTDNCPQDNCPPGNCPPG